MKKFMIHIVFEILLLCSLVFNTFISKKFDTIYTLIALVIFLVINLLLKRNKKTIKNNVSDVTFIVGCLSILYLAITYFIGFLTEYSINYNSMFKNYIEPISWIKVFLVVALTEKVRYVTLSWDDKHKIRNIIHNVVMIAIFVVIDIVLCTDYYDLTMLNQLYEFVSLVVLQSISKNIFLTYLTKKYGIKPCLVYRLLMDLYIYFLPYTPSLNVYIEGCVMLVFPYIVYVAIQKIVEKRVSAPVVKKKKENKLVSAICAVLFVILVALVSREFEYCMIAVGSGSMTGSINKGDAIIYKTYDKKLDTIEEGDVLVFYKDNRIIVHRLVTKHIVYSEEVYQTKGDANDNVDNWLVKQEDVIGIVKQRIPLIAWPSVKLNELFERLRGV